MEASSEISQLYAVPVTDRSGLVEPNLRIANTGPVCRFIPSRQHTKAIYSRNGGPAHIRRLQCCIAEGLDENEQNTALFSAAVLVAVPPRIVAQQ